MKHVGIAAVTAEGAALCLQTLCRRAQEIAGPHHHPEVTLHAGSFHRILDAQRADDWKTVASLMVESLRHLKDSGADFAIIPANSVHFAWEDIKAASPLPVWSLVDVASDECAARGYKKVLTLGVGITMSRGLYGAPLSSRGIESVVPSEDDQATMNRIIYDELVQGIVFPASVDSLTEIVHTHAGVDAVLLGCTELPLALNEENCGLPVIDTTRLLAIRAAEFACQPS